MKYLYPLATETWDVAEREALQRVIASGRFTMGEYVSQFEKSFADYLGGGFAVMVNSGSSANLLMLTALQFSKNSRYRLRPKDEVIVPAVSWSTTYFPVHQVNCSLRFVDVDPYTLNMSVASVEQAITPKTRAVLAVNLLGNPCDLEGLRRLCDEKKLVLLEDNCESLGAEYNDRPAGTFGLMGTFSTFFSHHISTMEGGVIFTKDEEIYHILLSLRAHGWTRQLPEVNHLTGRKDPRKFYESYKFILPGYNVRPLELSGAVGIEQLKKIHSLIKERRRNGEYWVKKMQDNLNFDIQKELGASSWFGFSLVLKHGGSETRDRVVNELERIGFECRPIVAGNFLKNPAVKFLEHSVYGDLVNSDRVDECGLFIGNHHYPILDAIDLIASLEF